MKTFKLDDFNNWFVGNFTPALYKKDYELGIKYYSKGDIGKAHYHKLSDEITIIIDGIVKINEIQYSKGDIIVQEKNEPGDFECISEKSILFIYRPECSDPNDKYFI